MDKLIIQGQSKLFGDVLISGAKNAALPILIGSLLTSDKLTLTNVPKLFDINTTVKLLQFLGVGISKDEDSIELIAKSINHIDAPI